MTQFSQEPIIVHSLYCCQECCSNTDKANLVDNYYHLNVWFIFAFDATCIQTSSGAWKARPGAVRWLLGWAKRGWGQERQGLGPQGYNRGPARIRRATSIGLHKFLFTAKYSLAINWCLIITEATSNSWRALSVQGLLERVRFGSHLSMPTNFHRGYTWFFHRHNGTEKCHAERPKKWILRFYGKSVNTNCDSGNSDMHFFGFQVKGKPKRARVSIHSKTGVATWVLREVEFELRG